MSTITVYDIKSSTFYTQTAGTAKGASLPNPRDTFCSVGVGAADNSTWEIFIYGGSNAGSSGYDIVFILTLPAFEWIEAPVGNGTIRSLHHCQIIGERQMLSIGGFNTNFTTVDPWTNGLGIFDLTDLSWGFNYNANAAPYVRSTLVQEYYNTSNRYPSTWSNPDLEAIFNITSSGPAAPSISSPSSSPSPSPSSSSHSNTGAIAGGVAGGVAFLAVLIGLAWILLRKKRRNSQIRYEVADTSDPHGPRRDQLHAPGTLLELEATPKDIHEYYSPEKKITTPGIRMGNIEHANSLSPAPLPSELGGGDMHTWLSKAR